MIHKLADVQTTQIGESTNIWQFCVVLSGAKIGSNCNINCNCFIENKVAIGSNVTIKSGVYIWDGVSIEDNAFIGPCVAFTNDLFPRSKQYPDYFALTTVCKNASIGANSTIIAGVRIGMYALIGAGSVVTRDVPPHALCYGNPARIHGYVCVCGHKIGLELECPTCGRLYKREGEGLALLNENGVEIRERGNL